MMWKSLVVVGALSITGCKTEEAASSNSSGPAATEGAQPAPSTTKPRSGKIDLGMQRPARPERGGERPAPTDEQREDWRQRRDERRKERMAQLDSDGDGTLSEAELAAGRHHRAEQMHARLDTNGDGKLSLEEVGAAKFRRID